MILFYSFIIFHPFLLQRLMRIPLLPSWFVPSCTWSSLVFWYTGRSGREPSTQHMRYGITSIILYPDILDVQGRSRQPNAWGMVLPVSYCILIYWTFRAGAVNPTHEVWYYQYHIVSWYTGRSGQEPSTQHMRYGITSIILYSDILDVQGRSRQPNAWGMVLPVSYCILIYWTFRAGAVNPTHEVWYYQYHIVSWYTGRSGQEPSTQRMRYGITSIILYPDILDIPGGSRQPNTWGMVLPILLVPYRCSHRRGL